MEKKDEQCQKDQPIEETLEILKFEINQRKISMTKMSARHEEEIRDQILENQWLKKSLIECSSALHHSLSILKENQPNNIPDTLVEIAAKFNYENAANACKCSYCPTNILNSSSIGLNNDSCNGSGIQSNCNESFKINIPNIQNFKYDKKSNNNNDNLCINESIIPIFKNMKRDSSGLYSLEPCAKNVKLM